MSKANLPDIENFTRNHNAFITAMPVLSRPAAKKDRVELFFDVAADLPHGTSCSETKQIADTALNTIEDEFSGIPYAPPQGFNDDGRIYPAQEDRRRKSPVETVAIYRHKRHESFYGANGAISICTLGKEVCVDRAGSDSLTIGDLLEQSTQQLPRSGS